MIYRIMALKKFIDCQELAESDSAMYSLGFVDAADANTARRLVQSDIDKAIDDEVRGRDFENDLDGEEEEAFRNSFEIAWNKKVLRDFLEIASVSLNESKSSSEITYYAISCSSTYDLQYYREK